VSDELARSSAGQW